MTTDRFKATLGVHPAWRNGITIPAALLRQYRALGLDNGKLAYILQIIAAYWQGDEAGHKEIGAIMGVKPRQLRRYNEAMQTAGMIESTGRYMHGNRLENDYDLTPLLDAALALDIAQGRNKQERIDTAYSLIDQLVDAVDGTGNVQELLEQLSQEWRKTAEKPSGHTRPLETGHTRPLETGHTRPLETGHTRPLSTGHKRPLSTGHTEPVATRLNQAVIDDRLKEVTDDLSNVVVVPPDSLSLRTTTDNPINDRTLTPKLQSIGFSKNDAKSLIYTAIKAYGNESAPVIHGWLDYIKSQTTITKPPAFLYAKIKAGDIAPPVPAAVIESAAQSQATQGVNLI